MVTPEDVKNWDKVWLDQITERIDIELKTNHGDKDYEYAVIRKKISKEDRDSICKLYINAGWNYTYHKIEIAPDNREEYLSYFVLSMDGVPEFSQIAKAMKGHNVNENSTRYCHFWTELKNPTLVKE